MMRRRRRSAAAALALILLPCASAIGIAADVKEAVSGNNAFALELYAKLSGEKGNLFLSPHSISTALAMTYAGARGRTEAQMAQVLHLGENSDELHAAVGKLVAGLNAAGKKGGYQLTVANALWAQRDYKFLGRFTDLAAKNYGAALNQVDFKAATEAARQTINAWVEKQTNDKIKELLKPGVLSVLTRLVLTNAIYFKGDWDRKFGKEATRDAPFTLEEGTKVNLPMMHQTGNFPYAAIDDTEILELPYVRKDLSMLIFLPRRPDGLTGLEKKLTAKNLADWPQRLTRQEVAVAVPKFKLTCEFRLDGALRAMGMTDAFDESRADFSGMDGSRYLFISAVVHKAFVDVNEEGTEAAAATGVVVGVTSFREPAIFRADRPFFFIIRDNKTGGVLFIGRLTDPRK